MCSLLLQLLNFSTELAKVEFLSHLQVSGISMHALRNVIWKVMKCKSGLLLCSSDKGHCIGREGSEARKCEWCKLEDGAVWILSIEQCTVLHKDDTKPLQELEKLSQGNVLVEMRVGHTLIECLKLSFNPGEKIACDICRRCCKSDWIRKLESVARDDTHQAQLVQGSTLLAFVH
jgi:hypothetical protein